MFVSTFSWIEPFRPYLIVLSLLVLGFAWYQKLKPQKEVDCDCETNEKQNFIQSKTFLAILSAFAIIMLAFLYYSEIFYPNTDQQVLVLNKSDVKTSEFKINGMTCAGCEDHVNHEVYKLNGIVELIASYEAGNAIIKFDKTKTNEAEITEAINATGYIVTEIKEN